MAQWILDDPGYDEYCRNKTSDTYCRYYQDYLTQEHNSITEQIYRIQELVLAQKERVKEAVRQLNEIQQTVADEREQSQLRIAQNLAELCHSGMTIAGYPISNFMLCSYLF